MSEKSIFNNYVTECPKCSGELSPGDFLCPYCGYDLRELNEEYKDGEKQVTDAMNRVNVAESRLKTAEMYARQNSFKKTKRKGLLIAVLIVLGMFATLIIAAGLFTFFEISTDKKIEQITSNLNNQIVETIVMDDNSSLETEEYKNTTYQSVAGQVQENENTIKIPLSQQPYDSQAIHKIDLYINNVSYDEINFYDTDMVSIYGEDFSIRIVAENASYLENPIDTLPIVDSNMNEVSRLDDIQIGDVLFQCYLIDDDYYLTANPKPNLFITYEFNSYDFDKENGGLEFEEWMLIKHIKIETK